MNTADYGGSPVAGPQQRAPGAQLASPSARVSADTAAPLVAPRWSDQALLPFRGAFRPAAVGRMAAAMRPWQVVLVGLVGLLGVAVLLTALVLWSETFYDLAVPQAAPTGTAPVPFSYSIRAQRGVGDVLRDWGTAGIYSPPLIILGFVFLLGVPAVLALAGLHLPFVQRTEPLGAACGRALRLAPLALMPIGWGILVAGVAGNFARQLQVGTQEDWRALLTFRDPIFLTLASAAAGVWYLIVWLRRAAAGARGAGPGELSPRCEGCGYDLTHQPAEGRCSECGLGLAASLDPATRPGVPWAQRRTLRNWATTTWQVITAPAAFYRGLRLRDAHEPEIAFAAWTYVGIGVGALTFVGVATLAAILRYGAAGVDVLELGRVVVVMIAFGVAGCWAGHRANAAVVGALWLARAPLRDGRWAARIIGYESAYLWVFCALWGTLALSFIVWEDWVTELLGRHPFGPRYFGFPPEPLLVLGSTLALLALWWWRYRIAYRAVCWNNF